MTYDNGKRLSTEVLAREKDISVLRKQCSHACADIEANPDSAKARRFFDTAVYFYAKRWFEIKSLPPEEHPEVDKILFGNGKTRNGSVNSIKQKLESHEPIHTGYIDTALKHSYIDYLRLKGRTADLVQSLDEPVGAEQTFMDTLENSHTQQDNVYSSETAIRGHIAALPKHWRRVIEERAKGEKYEEIAETLNMPVGTVKTYIFQAKEQLRRTLSQSGALDADLAGMIQDKGSPSR